MRIEDFFLKGESSYVYMERYVNNGSPSGFDKVHTSSEETAPRGSNTSFSLPIIQFDEYISIDTIGADPLSMEAQCLFCHPDNLNNAILLDVKEHWKIVGEIQVSPTASARTVKWIGHDYFIKLDYMGYLGRITRNLDYQRLLSAYEVSRDLKSGVDSNLYNDKFAFQDESKGKVAHIPTKDGKTYEFGYVVREARPYSSLKIKNLFLVPAFSLFGTDVNAPTDDPIIIQLYKKSNLDINDFAYECLLRPIISCYFDPLIHHGLAMESHAQNTLIAIDEQFNILLVVARDMESVDKDLPLRETLGVGSPITSTEYKCLRRDDYNYKIKHSFMFDFKLGEYLISPLIETLSSVGSFDRGRIVTQIKELTTEKISMLPDDYFPSSWYSYDNIQFNSDEKRPYIRHDNPKYR